VTPVLAVLADLVLPHPCAACDRRGVRLTAEVCSECVAAVEVLRPRPVRPVPAPPGLPPCFALGDYAGELRELILSFKERGRHRLARPLGALLAEAVAFAVDGPVTLVYIPDSTGAARKRYGDHMRLLAERAAARLREAGRPAVAFSALKAHGGADSAHLDAGQRRLAALGKFAVTRLPDTPGKVFLIDDIITTGSTLAAAARILREAGVDVRGCVALAATRRTVSP
jgi:predicted amidophosphoribosyltransferase